MGLGLRILCAVICIAFQLHIAVEMGMRPALGFTKPNIAIFAGLFLVLALLCLPGAFAGRLRSGFAAFALGLLVATGMVEGYVRVFDPFPILLRGGRISLPVHAKKTFALNNIPGLDANISATFNSIGFRGPEPPRDWDTPITILCVGGSTTQCIYLSDGTTWPDRLAAKYDSNHSAVWINNAGIDGHSTFGHLELLDQILLSLRPKLLLFLVGLNDVDREDLSHYDTDTLRSLQRDDDSTARTIQRGLLRNSDAFALLDSFRLQWSARRMGLTHGEPVGHGDFASLAKTKVLSDQERSQWLAQRNPACLDGYKARLEAIIQRCDDNKIECILMTQPVLYGEGTDNVTGIDLERVPVGEVDGWTHWRLLQQYNAVTMQIGSENNVDVIDLANKLPKSSQYFYDLTHYNKDGAAAVAAIVFQELELSQLSLRAN
jgi:hypothetical protein